MGLPTFATLDDLDIRRPGGLKDRERPRAWAALVDASALIRETANGKTWANDAGTELVEVPDLLVAITCAAARRALDNPDGIQQETLGAYSVQLANSSGDIYLTQAEQRLVRKVAGLGGVFALAPTRDPDHIGFETPTVGDGAVTEWLEVDPPGDPIPWAGPV